jgi:hypothetical protein
VSVLRCTQQRCRDFRSSTFFLSRGVETRRDDDETKTKTKTKTTTRGEEEDDDEVKNLLFVEHDDDGDAVVGCCCWRTSHFSHRSMSAGGCVSLRKIVDLIESQPDLLDFGVARNELTCVHVVRRLIALDTEFVRQSFALIDELQRAVCCSLPSGAAVDVVRNQTNNLKNNKKRLITYVCMFVVVVIIGYGFFSDFHPTTG